MSIASSLGPQSLLQLGVSLSDIALLYSQGRRLGNWFTIKRNDEDLFDSLMEDPEILLKRKGLVVSARMDSLFPNSEFIYHGRKVNSGQKKLLAEERRDLRPFSWLMIVVVSVLDLCLPPPRITDLLIDIFVLLLENSEAENSLRISLDVNIESWRSAAKIRGIFPATSAAFKKSWQNKTGEKAIPQLNQAETEEMKRFIYDLMLGEITEFTCISATTFAAALAIQQAGIYITTTSNRNFEGEFIVTYSSNETASSEALRRHHPRIYNDANQLQKTLVTRAQTIAYPAGQPETMVHTVSAPRSTINRMTKLWHLGADAARKFSLFAKADLPFHPADEIYYELHGNDYEVESFSAFDSVIAGKAFPCESQSILSALEKLTEGQTTYRKQWLEVHAGLEFLSRNESTIPSRRDDESMNLWLCYQALIFGFYYKLFEPMITLDFLSRKDTYFQGLWGYGSTTFLAMCTQFGQELRQRRRVGRSHVLYMLATMYAGRQKTYSPNVKTNLVGILGPTSIVALSLLRTTDIPQELAKYAVLDLPILQLVSEDDGELFAGTGLGITFNQEKKEAKVIHPHGPRKKWSVHSSMRKAFRDGGSGVVMAARCEGRLVGWFSPSAADTMFLSTAYQHEQHKEEEGVQDGIGVSGTEIIDEHWQSGSIWRPLVEECQDNSFGIVHSVGCPALRYAAAGFYGGSGEEVSIATDDISAAFGRIEAQDSGIIIA